MADIPDSHRDIIERSQAVILATNGPTGQPQVTATWFLWEDDTLKVSLNSSRQKTRNLLRDPHLTAFFIDPENPYRTIELRGIAAIEDDPEYTLADRVGAKYGANIRENDRPGETRYAITLVPEKVLTFGS